MLNCDLIIHNASQLLTCASANQPKRGASMRDAGVIEDGAIAVKGGKIVGVGRSADIVREYNGRESIDARGKTVAPGFVECHTHLVYAGDRLGEFELKIKGADYLEILQSGGGILSTVRATRAAALSELVAESRRRLDKMHALGVTVCEVKTGYGLDAATEMKMLEAIVELDRQQPVELVPTFLPAHAVPPEFKENPDEYVALICDEMLPKLKEWRDWAYLDPDRLDFAYKRDKPFFVDVFCERGAFDLAQSRRVLEKAKELGFRLKAHVDEFTNLGGARASIELGAASIDHLDAISDEEITLLAASETIGVVTPTVNFNFGSAHFADARKLIDAGCAVAVSTDYNPGSAPCPSLPNAMAIACRYQKLLPAEAFNAATVNAAFAVGLGARAGSLEIGKQADIVIFDPKDYREIVYEFGGNMVERVIKAAVL